MRDDRAGILVETKDSAKVEQQGDFNATQATYYDYCLLRWGNILRDLVLTDHGDALG